MSTPKLKRIKETSEITGFPVRMLQNLQHQRKIPFVKVGHRTVFFDPDKVLAAIAKFEVKAVA